MVFDCKKSAISPKTRRANNASRFRRLCLLCVVACYSRRCVQLATISLLFFVLRKSHERRNPSSAIPVYGNTNGIESDEFKMDVRSVHANDQTNDTSTLVVDKVNQRAHTINK